ncbi:GAF and ANTAR domain-containing protein [Gordonia insulae]|uniref:ANTAR domain-containing protein n=1 Tax=Gordonia insulae TaxID=2420509 RepID=A0A3G8JNU8_9ACTN|nr:GAF and ANTAR domain-containing protein [Gordonia insulae]AZG46325.1 hypothetical protein D7316_02926 [Gordonia insulae]
MDVHREIAELARKMHAIPERDDSGIDRVMETITFGSVEHVPGARWASVLLIDKKKSFDTVAPTDPVMVTLDQLQKQTGQGPCVDAAWDQSVVHVDDIAADPRWPELSARTIAETPARSSLSFQLFNHRGAMGALNLFSDEIGAFDSESVEIGLVFATHAAIAVFRTRQQSDFQSALATRDVIGQAKGMIMERFKVDAVQSFEMLRQLSQESNTPLADVARRIIEAG